MRLLLISNHLRGGANRAMFRHHLALREAGIDCRILIGAKLEKPMEHVYSLEAISEQKLGYPNPGLKEKMHLLPKLELIRESDILEFRSFHNAGHPDVFDIDVLRSLAALKPLVWRLSDMWAFTGFCSYAFGCQKWRSHCIQCPQIEGADQHKREIRIPNEPIEEAFHRKSKVYKNIGSKLHIVGPSKWMLNQAREGILHHASSFTHVPIGIELDIYRPYPKAQLRRELNLPIGKTLISACISNPKNYRKAADLLWEALRKVKSNEFAILLIGTDEVSLPPDFPDIPIYKTSFLSDAHLQAKYYAASDIFCFSSRCDNSAQTLGEASACGLPVVCFDVGGNSEYVLHEKTGLVINPYQTGEMAAALDHLIANSDYATQLGKAGTCEAIHLCGERQQTGKFINLYKTILTRKFEKSSDQPNYNQLNPYNALQPEIGGKKKSILVFCPNTGGHRHIYAYFFIQALNEPDNQILFAYSGLKGDSGYLPHESDYLNRIFKDKAITLIQLGEKSSAGSLTELEHIQAKYQPNSTLIVDGDVLIKPILERIKTSKPLKLLGDNFGMFILSEFIYTEKPGQLRGISKADYEYFYFDILKNHPAFTAVFITDENIVERSQSVKFLHLPDIRATISTDPGKGPESGFSQRIQSEINAFCDRNSGREIVLLFGDLENRKGYDFLLQLVDQNKDLILLRVGRTKPSFSLSWQITQLKETLYKEDRFMEIDCYTPPDIIDFLFKKLNFLLLPYRNFFRTSGVMMDSIHEGIPVLVPDIGLMADRVKRNGIGRVYEHENFEDFVKQFNELIQNIDKFKSNIYSYKATISEEKLKETARVVLNIEASPKFRDFHFGEKTLDDGNNGEQRPQPTRADNLLLAKDSPLARHLEFGSGWSGLIKNGRAKIIRKWSLGVPSEIFLHNGFKESGWLTLTCHFDQSPSEIPPMTAIVQNVPLRVYSTTPIREKISIQIPIPQLPSWENRRVIVVKVICLKPTDFTLSVEQIVWSNLNDLPNLTRTLR